MAQHHVFNRLVGDLADPVDDILGHVRGGLGVNYHDPIVTDDDAGVGVALGGIGVGVGGQLGEANDLGLEVVL